MVEVIADELEKRIQTRVYPSGKLPKLERLAYELDVPRLALHEAIKLLKARRLVQTQHRRGTFILAKGYPPLPPPVKEAGSMRATLAAICDRLDRMEKKLDQLVSPKLP